MFIESADRQKTKREMTECVVKYIDGCAPCALHDKDHEQRAAALAMTTKIMT